MGDSKKDTIRQEEIGNVFYLYLIFIFWYEILDIKVCNLFLFLCIYLLTADSSGDMVEHRCCDAESTG